MNQELPVTTSPDLRPPSPGLEKEKGRGRVIAGGAILAVIVFILFYFFRPDGEDQASTIKINDVEIQAEIADDLGEQVRGLSGRDSLCETCGMLFVYDKPQFLTFWMKEMKFALDIIFMRDGKVIEIYENVSPPGETGGIPAVIRGREPADVVLEVNSGFTDKHGLRISDPAQLK